jgi:hypothetical protein
MEYSLERALGDHFTRFWPLTNHGLHGIGKDEQLAAIVHRHEIVADLCYHANVCSSLRQGKNTVDETSMELRYRTTTVTLTGKTYPVMATGFTTFKYETNPVGVLLMNKLRQNEQRMVPPYTVSDTMRIPLQNRSVKRGAVNRIEVLTLRAKRHFFGKPRYDNVKVLVSIVPLPCGRDHDIYFARCVAFFRDSENNHFAAVQWYDKAGPRRIQKQARLAKVKPMKVNAYASYDIVPVGSILNGALLVKDRGIKQRARDPPQYWVRQSPREYNHLLHYYGEQPFVEGESQLMRDRLQ